jgi:hypothetical protein
MKRDPLARAVACFLATTLPLIFSPAWAASPTAVLTGKILASDAATPVTGAVVNVGNPTGAVHSSAPSSEDGSFRLSDLPPGDYRITVETDEGYFAVVSPVTLEAGKVRSVEMALKKGPVTEPIEIVAPAASSMSDTRKVLVGFAALAATTIFVKAFEEDNIDRSISPLDLDD